MTGVQKLMLLPAPGAKPVAPSAAASRGQGEQQVEAVVRSPAIHSRDGQRGPLRNPVEQHRWEEQEGAERQRRVQADQEPVKGRRISFSRLTSLGFMVQVLGQQSQAARESQTAQLSPLSQHRDGALIGSDSYRKAGGEPELLPEGATFVRLAV